MGLRSRQNYRDVPCVCPLLIYVGSGDKGISGHLSRVSVPPVEIDEARFAYRGLSQARGLAEMRAGGPYIGRGGEVRSWHADLRGQHARFWMVEERPRDRPAMASLIHESFPDRQALLGAADYRESSFQGERMPWPYRLSPLPLWAWVLVGGPGAGILDKETTKGLL